MYKTTVYTLVNGCSIRKRWYYAAWHCL